MKKLVAYITSGYPDNQFTIDAAAALKEGGADILELGVPFSDPVADGPVIEKANLQVLQNGFKLDDLFGISEKAAKEIDTLWMGYFNPFYHKGIDFFMNKAREYGVNGFIIPDLPHEESVIYKDKMQENALALIDFVAPTDSLERIRKITSQSQKFIYLVAYAGITGAQQQEDLSEVIGNIRECSSTDVFIGFGVNEKTAKEKAKGVDGVIVGSAFVNILLNQDLTNLQKLDNIKQLASTIKEEINS